VKFTTTSKKQAIDTVLTPEATHRLSEYELDR
jgi:DNA-binding TFAR19-related protein (PDSD5 family)